MLQGGNMTRREMKLELVTQNPSNSEPDSYLHLSIRGMGPILVALPILSPAGRAEPSSNGSRETIKSSCIIISINTMPAMLCYRPLRNTELNPAAQIIHLVSLPLTNKLLDLLFKLLEIQSSPAAHFLRLLRRGLQLPKPVQPLFGRWLILLQAPRMHSSRHC